MENVVGQKSEQQKALDGPGVVTIDVVRMPAVDEFIEPVILNIPADGRLRNRRTIPLNPLL